MLGRKIFLALWAWGALSVLPVMGEVKVTRSDFRSWKGVYRLSNGVAELVFAPQIGRVIFYGYAGGENMLWVNPQLEGKTTNLAAPEADWRNYGGDKLWLAPQYVWGWPPDPVLDSGEQKVTVTKDRRLLVEGRVSPKHKTVFRE